MESALSHQISLSGLDIILDLFPNEYIVGTDSDSGRRRVPAFRSGSRDGHSRGEGGIRPMPFQKPIKICFGDIDNAGIVYYPRLIHYFHLAMEEFFSSEIGVDYAEVLHKRNVSLPTVHLEADFRRRLRYGDEINMEVRIIKIGQSSITWGYRGYRRVVERELVVEGENVTVCVSAETFLKKEIPKWLRKALTDYMERYNRESSQGI